MPKLVQSTLLLAMLAVIGCVPQTRYRRSAMVPAVTRPVHTAPVEGVAEIGGSATVANVETDWFPEVGDPALYVPELELEGHARFRVGPMAIGMSGHFAWLQMTDITALGTPPIEKRLSWGLGPQVSFSHRFGTSLFGLGAVGSVSFNSAPWAVYEMNASGTGYALRDSGQEVLLLYRLAVAFHLHAHERLLISFGPAVANHAKNVGFSDSDLEGSTLTTNTHGFVPFVGVRYIDPSGFFAQAQMAFPVGFSHIDITPVTGSFTIGVALGDTPEPAPEPEPEPIVLPAAPASPPPAAAPIIVVPVYEPEKHESATPVPAPAPAPDAP